MPQFPANIDLSSLNGTNGFKISGEGGGGYSGRSVASAGDMNGDGFSDLVIAAPEGDAAYVVFGAASGIPANLDLSSLDGHNGFKLNGVYSLAGASVASAGDVNGDGLDDLVVGAGSLGDYVVFGKTSGFSATFDLSSLDGANGFKINGIPGRGGVASAGDVNGDGFDDLVIGAAYSSVNGYHAGSAYVVFSQGAGFSATFDLSNRRQRLPPLRRGRRRLYRRIRRLGRRHQRRWIQRRHRRRPPRQRNRGVLCRLRRVVRLPGELQPSGRWRSQDQRREWWR